MSPPLLDVVTPPQGGPPSRWQRPGWPTAVAMLVGGAILGAMFAPRQVQTVTVPATTTDPATTGRPATTGVGEPAEAEETATIAVSNGGTIRVQVAQATLDGHGRYVVRVKVRNTGAAPFETYYLDAELEDGQGRRFGKETGTTDDIPGELNPDQAGVVVFRFKLPAEAAKPAALYVGESPGGGELAPVALP